MLPEEWDLHGVLHHLASQRFAYATLFEADYQAESVVFFSSVQE